MLDRDPYQYQDLETLREDIGRRVTCQVPQRLMSEGGVSGVLEGVISVDQNEPSALKITPDGHETMPWSPVLRDDQDVVEWKVTVVEDERGDPNIYPEGSIERVLAVQLMDLRNMSAKDLALWVEILAARARKFGIKNPMIIGTLGGLDIHEKEEGPSFRQRVLMGNQYRD